MIGKVISNVPLAQLRKLAGAATRVARIVPRGALGLVFPTVCVSCGQEVADHNACDLDVPFCRPCLAELPLNSRSVCARCAAPLPGGVEPVPVSGTARPKDCLHCHGRRFRFQSAISAGRYTGRLRDLVLRMKSADENYVALAMGRLIWEHCGGQLNDLSADVLVPVPMHWRRRMAHGTNSAALLAEVLAQRLQKPLHNRLLRRSRNTAPQFSLSPPQRRANVRGCFTAKASKRLENAHVLLVDDIMTSGATCNEAARVLRQAGAGRVTVVVAARAVSQ